MIKMGMFTTIRTLWERGQNKSEISRATRHDWKTVAKVVKEIEAGKTRPEKKQHPKILDLYKEQIIQWIEYEGLNGLKIFERLKSLGVKLGYSTVTGYLAQIKKRENIFIRITTKPGEEGQVDFGYIGITPDNKGKRRKSWIFCMNLSYCRLSYYERVFNQRVETFIQCHINAFEYFGGVPEYVKIDNLKAAILEANFYEPVYQELYKNLASYYGFKPQPCRVRRAKDKGKVESGIKYYKGNFMVGRKFRDGSDFNRQSRNWIENTCNCRVHGTTRKIPREVFEAEERNKLIRLPLERFKTPDVGTRKVYHDCDIYVGYNYYSVPFEYVGKEVDIEMNKDLLKISYQGNEIAIHQKLQS